MTAAERALRTYLENHTEDCSINLAEEYAHGHITFCIRGGLPIHWVFIGAEGDLYFYSRRPGHLQAKGYMKPTEQEIIDLIRYINNELVGWEMIKY
jgi:hypothetical protein